MKMMSRCSVQEKLGTPPSTPLMKRKYGSSAKYNRLVPPRRPDIVESSKRHGEYNESGSRKYIEKKKNKVVYLDKLPEGHEKLGARQEPVVKKRKRVTGSGHNFKSRLAKRAKGTVPEEPRVSQAEKVSSYQETEEQVQSGNPKKQWLKPKVISPQGPRDTIINQKTSSHDEEWLDNPLLSHRLADRKTKKASAQEEGYEDQNLLKRKKVLQDYDRQESFRGEHCTKEILSPKKRPVKETGAGNERGKDYACAEGCESRILSKKNQASKDEGAGNEIGKDCARAECFGNQTRSMKKQAMKDRVSGNEIINDSAREERCKKQPSQKRQALKDKDLGIDIVREKHYENQTLTETLKEVKGKGEGNDTGQNSSKEDHHENQINSKKKQAAEHQGIGDEIEKDSVAGEEHQENRITSEEKQGVKDKGARKEIEKDSSSEDSCGNQVLTQKKQAVIDEGVDSLIDSIQKKCDKRMRKLIRKQKQEVQAFQQIWEERILKLNMDRKLDLAIIRCLYKKNSSTFADKVKLLDGQFAKKMEAFNLLKDVQLKDLEANHLAAKIQEREKQDGWLAKAKPCQSSELKGVCGPESSGSLSEKVCGFPQPSTQDVVPITMHNVDEKNPCKSVRRNDVKMSKDSVSTDLKNDVHAPLDLSLSDHSSNRGFDDGDQTGSSGALVNQRDETDETTTSGSPIFEQMLETLELQASEDEIYQGLSSAVIQDEGAQLVEKQETSLVEEDASEHIDNVKDQVTLQIEVDNTEIVDSVNSLQDEGAQLVEKHNSSDHVDSVTLLPSNIEVSSNASYKGIETNKATFGSLPLLEQLLEPSEPPGLEDAIPQLSTSAVLQYLGAQVVENRSTSLFNREACLIEVANKEACSVKPVNDKGAQVVEKQYTSDNLDTVNTLPSNIKVQDQEPAEEEQVALQIESGNFEPVDRVNPAQCDDALLICYGDVLQVEAENQSHNADRNCPQIAPMEENASVPQESSSQSESNGELLIKRSALVVEEQFTSLIEVANNEVDSVNPVHDEGAQLVEKQYTSDNMDVVMTLPSNIRVQDQEPVEEEQFALQIEPGNCEPVDTVNPAHCNDALLICNGDELQIEAENQSHNAERNCPQIAPMEETASVPQESSSQSESNGELLIKRSALVVEDQFTSLIEVANNEVDSVNPVHDEGAQVVEKQYTSDNMDVVMTLPSNIRVQDQEPVEEEQFALQIEPGNCEPVDTVNPAHCNDALLICNSDELQIEAENQSHNAERNCPQIAPMEETASVPQESSSQSESNGELLSNRNALVVEDQVTSLIEVANKEVGSVNPVHDEGAQVFEKQYTSDNADNVMTLPSNIEVQGQESVDEEQFALQIEPGNCEAVDSVNPAQYDDVLLIFNGDELMIEAEIQSHNAERNSPQIAQMEETASVPQESSQLESNGELQSNIEHLTSSQNTVDFLRQDGLQPGSLEHLYGPSYLFPDPNHHSYGATFRAELERINAETERLKKSHEDMVSQLSSDRKKEMLEMIAQIDRKYKLKLQDAEAEFSSKKNGLENNHKKVLKSKLLAEVLGYTCLGLCSIGLPNRHQAPVSSCMQHQPQQHLMSPHPVTTNPGQPLPSPLFAGCNTTRPPPVATFSGQPATGYPIPRPNLQSMQHQPLQHFIGPPSMATYPGQPAPCPPHPGSNLQAMQQLFMASQFLPHSHLQTARHAAVPGSFGSTSRPPVIGSITPSVGNPHYGGGIHSLLPHLHSSRPTTNFPPVIQHLPSPPPGFQNMPQVQGRLTGQPNPLDPSVMNLPLDVDDLVHTPLEQAYWDRQRLCSVQGYLMTSRAVPPDSIFISDDD